jgi:hypothetical protein
MTRTWRPLALAVLGFWLVDLKSAQAQVTVSGGRTVTLKPVSPTVDEAPSLRRRRPWRERNPYFVARPVYPPAAPGARLSFTLEPYTSKYYPTGNSFYPPLSVTPPIRNR